MAESLVWYACYGSNILKERFLYYIEGGICRYNAPRVKNTDFKKLVFSFPCLFVLSSITELAFEVVVYLAGPAQRRLRPVGVVGLHK